MQNLIIAPIVIFFALLSGEIIFVANDARAANCCMCGKCGSRCICPGASLDCPYCAAPDLITSQTNSALTTVVSIRGIGASLLSLMPTSDGTDQMIRVPGTIQCIRDNFRLKLFDADALQKFVPAFLQEIGARHNMMAMK